MARCHPFPHTRACSGWLLSDPRLDAHGLRAARRLRPGSYIIVRSDDLPAATRRLLIRRLRRIAAARRCQLLVAGLTPDQAQRLGMDGVHLRDRSRLRATQARQLGLRTSAPVHNGREARAVQRAGIDYALISPLHATRSHPGADPLTMRTWLRLARQSGAQPVALGGMTRARARGLRKVCARARFNPGWAAIDAWETKQQLRTRQKRNCVPT
jgi:thiamine-phosphate pyrophosphorylase